MRSREHARLGLTAVPLFLLLALAPGVTRAQRGPSVPAAAAPRACELPAAPLSGTVTLEPDCRYEGTLVLDDNDTVLDCAGATVASTSGRSIRVVGDIHDVTIRDCYVGGGGISVAPAARRPDEDDDSLRARAPKNVVIEGCHVAHTFMTGVFLGPCSVGVTVRRSIVEDAASAGIYLEWGTQHAVIEDNLIVDNGFRYGDGLPRVDWQRREGLAIDAAAYTVVAGNTFRGNAFGGVFLYKNCWEFAHGDPNGPQRLQHAHDNVIRDNVFEDTPIGVWIAARQARDLGVWDCGDPTPYPNPLPLAEAFPEDYPAQPGAFPAPWDYAIDYLGRGLMGLPCEPAGDCAPERESVWIWPDFAEDNTVIRNRFERIEVTGVRVEDDRAHVSSNLFVGAFPYVYVGTPFRSRWLDQPVRGTVVADNDFVDDAAPGFEAHLSLAVGEHVDTDVRNNARACVLPWGGVLASGGEILAYRAEAAVDDGGACVFERRHCWEGALAGSFGFAACSGGPEVEYEPPVVVEEPDAGSEDDVADTREDDAGAVPDPDSDAKRSGSGCGGGPGGPASGALAGLAIVALADRLRRRPRPAPSGRTGARAPGASGGGSGGRGRGAT
ncbi:MAG: right-handed parallel beta-helix repeat-containing protein [Deltaproteobacteria bacterium]|nr:MAG: right-handed parallel beta-helix repeat-containing protein [Deltaproteobacteria bacterium]